MKSVKIQRKEDSFQKNVTNTSGHSGDRIEGKKLRLRMPDDTLKMDSWLLLVYISVAVVINATRKDMNYKSHKIVTSLLTTVLLLGK